VSNVQGGAVPEHTEAVDRLLDPERLAVTHRIGVHGRAIGTVPADRDV
jgi:hypothetical protein